MMSNEKKPLSATDAAKLLDLLTTDAAFRAAFQADPPRALLQVSAEAAAAAQDCEMPGELASIEALSAARAQLTQHFTENATFSVPHCFISGDPSPRP